MFVSKHSFVFSNTDIRLVTNLSCGLQLVAASLSLSVSAGEASARERSGSAALAEQVLLGELAEAEAALEGAQRQARRAAEERDVMSGQLLFGERTALSHCMQFK